MRLEATNHAKDIFELGQIKTLSYNGRQNEKMQIHKGHDQDIFGLMGKDSNFSFNNQKFFN